MSGRAERVEAIRGRVEKTTEGPWHYVWSTDSEIDPGAIEGVAEVVTELGDSYETIAGVCGYRDIAEADADFIAHAREDVPWLCAEIDRLREERERLKDALDEPGPSTEEIKARARVLLTDQGASPSNLAYLAARMEWRLKRAHRALTDSEEER